MKTPSEKSHELRKIARTINTLLHEIAWTDSFLKKAKEDIEDYIVDLVGEELCKEMPDEYDPNCGRCRRYVIFGGPSHYGSRWCKCHSIASGGTRAHCSCDTCW